MNSPNFSTRLIQSQEFSTNTRVQVVRGYNRGKQITSTRVQHQTDPTGAAHRTDIDFELVGDSPNILAIFANRSDDPDVAIIDDTSQLDHGFLVRRDRLCSWARFFFVFFVLFYFSLVQMICLSCNCQGATSRIFRRTLQQFFRDFSPDMICLLEPKVSGTHANNICTNIGFEDWILIEVVGFSRGIWIFWKLSLSIKFLYTHPQFINLQVEEQQSSP